jgi:hypothetical protein
MKRTAFTSTAVLAILISLASFAFRGPSVRESLEQSFQKHFPNAENVHWNEDPNGYTVSFTIKTILTRINYDRKGRFTGSLRNYSEQLLPFYLINILKQKYPGQDIYGVTEITNATDINYFVKLESPSTWTTVRLDNDGNSAIIERYNKGN